MFRTSIGSWRRRDRREIFGSLPRRSCAKAGLVHELVCGCLIFISVRIFVLHARQLRGALPQGGGRIFRCFGGETELHLFRGRKQKWRDSAGLLDLWHAQARRNVLWGATTCRRFRCSAGFQLALFTFTTCQVAPRSLTCPRTRNFSD